MTLAELDRLVLALPARTQADLAVGPSASDAPCAVCTVLNVAAQSKVPERRSAAERLGEWHSEGTAERGWVLHALAGYSSDEA